MARAGGRAHPLELALEGLDPRLVLLLRLGELLALLVQPRGVVALPGDAVAAVQLEHPAGDVVQEVAVVGDDHHGPLVLAQVPLEPGHRLGVEVVGGLVQQQQVGLLQQQLAERDAAHLAAGQRLDLGVAGRAAQRVHRDLERAVQLPALLGVDLVLQRAHLVHQRGHLVVVDRLAHAHG